MNRLVLGFMLSVLTACATTPAPLSEDITLSLRLVDDDGNYVLRPDLPNAAWVELPLIPGAIYGAVTTEPQYRNVIKLNRRITIDGDFFTRRIADYATPLLRSPYTENLVVTPANTRLVRVATMAYAPRSGDFLGPTGLSGPDASSLILVYFDRPTELRGYTESGGERTDYAVSIRRPGLAWLVSRDVAQGHYRLENYTPTGDEYISVTPPARRSI
ncbi:hypothetical protein [Marinimicrobium alkaliphilum]|uniref:hypothetical protein n=1 Tax=Marinimicrobium alkaliphilum TaxID=2202654 RepID=UPI000DBA0611|nr:hypothetical protein [Marinimicrobium alkaliphilum]